MATNKKCPACGTYCEIDQARFELGLPIECVCGCKFDVLLADSPNYHSQTQKLHTKEKKDKPFTKKLAFKHLIYPSLVILGVGIIYVSWRQDWLKLLYTASFCLIVFCWKQKSNWKKKNDKSLSYFFFDKCVEFFSPLTIVLVFYLFLSLIFNGISNWATINVLEKFESNLDSIYQYVAWFKPKYRTKSLTI